MDFFTHAGVLALGSRLRRLSETFTAEAAQVFALYDVELDPKWFPVFYALSNRGEASVSVIAREIGHSHASVSQIVGEMKRAGLVGTRRGDVDGRLSVVRLSAKGRDLLPKIEPQYRDVRRAVEDLLAAAPCNLWTAIEETERLLEQKSFLERVREARGNRERDGVEIIAYEPRFQEAFKRLNQAWIEQYWTMEEADYRSLDDPGDYIIARGGHILLARRGEAIVGTCALIPMANATYELAKMAVAESEKGKGLGRLLGEAAIRKARSLGADRLYLESNTVLEPAIALYRKLGFREVLGDPSPYQRCNIQMELRFTD